MKLIFAHLKLWITVARHNFDWVKIMFETIVYRTFVISNITSSSTPISHNYLRNVIFTQLWIAVARQYFKWMKIVSTVIGNRKVAVSKIDLTDICTDTK